MKEGWEVKRLGDVCDVVNGGTPKTNVPKYWDGNFAWLTPAEMGKLETPFINNTTRKLTKEGILHSSAKAVPPYSIILSSRAPIGYLVINIIDMSFNQGCKGLVPNSKLFYKFLYYFLFNNIKLLNDLGTGTTFKELSGTKIKDIPIPVPSLPEQERIVGILDNVFDEIKKAKEIAQQNLKNAKEIFDSTLNSIFTNKGNNWVETTLGEVCEISSKLIDPRNQEFKDLYHVGAGNIETHTGTLLELKKAEEEKLISGKFLFDNTMVLYSKIRPYLKKVVNCNFNGLCSADIYPLKPFQKLITKNFLFHLLLNFDFTNYAILGSQRAGMPKVNREHLFAYKFYLPSLKEQQAIVAKLDVLSEQTKQLEAIYQQKLSNLEELKKSVLQKAFNGEL